MESRTVRLSANVIESDTRILELLLSSISLSRTHSLLEENEGWYDLAYSDGSDLDDLDDCGSETEDTLEMGMVGISLSELSKGSAMSCTADRLGGSIKQVSVPSFCSLISDPAA